MAVGVWFAFSVIIFHSWSCSNEHNLNDSSSRGNFEFVTGRLVFFHSLLALCFRRWTQLRRCVMSCWSILITFQRRQIFERSRRGAVCSSLRFFSSETFSSDDENCLRKASTSWWKKAAIKRVNHRELKKAKRAEEAYLDMETATIVKSQRVWKCVRDARSAGSMNDRAESIFVIYHFSLPPRLSADRWRVIHKGCKTSLFLETTRPISLSRELYSFMLATSSAQLICTTFRKHRAHACSRLLTSWHTFSSLRKLFLFSILFSRYSPSSTHRT